MESPAHSPATARSLRGRATRATMPTGAVILFALGSVLLPMGCGGSVERAPSPTSLVTGRRAAPLPSAQLASVTAAAHAFARAYASTAYLRTPPRLPNTTPAVRQALSAAASRVPAGRRRLRARAVGLELRLESRHRIEASVRIVDGRSPAFSIGFTLAWVADSWKIVSVSTPG